MINATTNKRLSILCNIIVLLLILTTCILCLPTVKAESLDNEMIITQEVNGTNTTTTVDNIDGFSNSRAKSRSSQINTAEMIMSALQMTEDEINNSTADYKLSFLNLTSATITSTTYDEYTDADVNSQSRISSSQKHASITISLTVIKTYVIIIE